MPTFTNIAPELGINLKIDIYGPNLVDYNGDGRLDLLFTNHNKYPLTLFQQQPSGQVTDVTALVQIDPNGDMHGAAWGDCDHDGRLDLYISLGVVGGNNSQPKRLYRQLANGTFVDVATQAGVADELGRGRSASWVDYDNDGQLDLLIINAPRADNQVSSDKLFHNEGDCTFSDMSGQAGDLAAGNHWHGSSWADYDNDGDMDVFVTSWQTPGFADLYRNNGNGTFSLVSASAGIIDETYRGMAWGDYDNDGDPDLFAARGYNSSLSDPGHQNRLYRNEGNGSFNEVGQSAGVVPSHNSQHAMWADFNNDGYLDLFVINAGDVHLGNQPDFLYLNKGDGTFRDVGAAANATGSMAGLGGGGAVGDFDADGFLDLVITNGENGTLPEFYGPHQLLRNGGNTNHWLQIKLIGRQSNSLGIGARVELRTADGFYQMREMNGGGHYFSQNEMLIHFGLGQRSNPVEATIYWPSGLIQHLSNMSVDQCLTVTETESSPVTPTPTSVSQPCHYSSVYFPMIFKAIKP